MAASVDKEQPQVAHANAAVGRPAAAKRSATGAPRNALVDMVFLSRTNGDPHDGETRCGPFRQREASPRQSAGRAFGRKTQESGGGPRGVALDQSSRSSGLALERSA